MALLEGGWEALAQWNSEQKSSGSREEQIQTFSLPLRVTPLAFLSSKSKRSFHQEPPKTSSQFSELEECRVTGQLTLCLPDKFSSFQVTKEKTRQFWSSLKRLVDHAGPVWANSFAEGPSVAPGDAGQTGGGSPHAGRWTRCQAAETLPENRELAAK